MMNPVPVIDLFAGPGGLGEGFSSLIRSGSERFKIGLSIEKDPRAHRTLQLRSFFRQFAGDAPEAYYEHLRGELSREELMSLYPHQAAAAEREAWCAELGNLNGAEMHNRVRRAIARRDDWVLIGGPPCQAYSLVGRSRMRGADPAKYDSDPRHFLYQEYLAILARYQPAVFVMENVKGLLSSTINGESMFDRIVGDLSEPARAIGLRDRPRLRYRLHALANSVQRSMSHRNEEPANFIVKAEQFGIPQARHRVIIVGVRDDVGRTPRPLTAAKPVPLKDVLADLPPLRSQISRSADSAADWNEVLSDCARALERSYRSGPLVAYLNTLEINAVGRLNVGAEFMKTRKKPQYRPDWYRDDRLGGVCNHVSRSHLRTDIQRYFFSAVFAASLNGSARSPVLADFPEFLLPNHENVAEGVAGNMFSDRFRVQPWKRPATTVTSHIAKDGHYYIHPDPLQARSLTVREAARLQTFPDNYFFCGPRTSQYQQVGNAVPPLLAHQIAEIVDEVLSD
jgi:DNA (cytosine-5)-methyltransferase 1